MLNKIRRSLSTKIFLGISFIIFSVGVLMFVILRIFMPKTYENEMSTQFTSRIQELSYQMELSPMDKWEDMLMSFCVENNTGASIVDENNDQVASFNISVYTTDSDSIDKKNERTTSAAYVAPFESNGKTYTIIAYGNAKAVDQVIGIFTRIFPYILAIIVIISALSAFFYSRFLAKPIVDISNVSKKMTALNMSWRCDISRSDEIGILADNLNEMAERLSGALKELQTANEKLQKDIDKEREQEQRRRDFFSAISHELKTPVTILKGQLDGMILKVGKFKDRDKYLQDAYETTESIEKLVREIMVLAKLDTLILNPKNISLSGLIDKCLHIYANLAQNKGIQISMCYDRDSFIRADEEKLQTAVSNIIGNAVKHSPENSYINICTLEKDGKVTLSVENSGVHIEASELSQIWDPFYRTDKSRSRDTGGSGLGLYIVKSILDLHEFEYSFKNTNVGMKFDVVFPI